jgi:hypothetical protein
MWLDPGNRQEGRCSTRTSLRAWFAIAVANDSVPVARCSVLRELSAVGAIIMC